MSVAVFFIISHQSTKLTDLAHIKSTAVIVSHIAVIIQLYFAMPVIFSFQHNWLLCKISPFCNLAITSGLNQVSR